MPLCDHRSISKNVFHSWENVYFHFQKKCSLRALKLLDGCFQVPRLIKLRLRITRILLFIWRFRSSVISSSKYQAINQLRARTHQGFIDRFVIGQWTAYTGLAMRSNSWIYLCNIWYTWWMTAEYGLASSRLLSQALPTLYCKASTSVKRNVCKIRMINGKHPGMVKKSWAMTSWEDFWQRKR